MIIRQNDVSTSRISAKAIAGTIVRAVAQPARGIQAIPMAFPHSHPHGEFVCIFTIARIPLSCSAAIDAGTRIRIRRGNHVTISEPGEN